MPNYFADLPVDPLAAMVADLDAKKSAPPAYSVDLILPGTRTELGEGDCFGYLKGSCPMLGIVESIKLDHDHGRELDDGETIQIPAHPVGYLIFTTDGQAVMSDEIDSVYRGAFHSESDGEMPPEFIEYLNRNYGWARQEIYDNNDGDVPEEDILAYMADEFYSRDTRFWHPQIICNYPKEQAS